MSAGRRRTTKKSIGGLVDLMMPSKGGEKAAEEGEQVMRWDRLRVLAQTRQILSGLVEAKDKALEEAMERERDLRAKWDEEEAALRRTAQELRMDLMEQQKLTAAAKTEREFSELRVKELVLQLAEAEDDDYDPERVRTKLTLLEVRLERVNTRCLMFRSLAQRHFHHLRSRVKAVAAELQHTRSLIASVLDGFSAWLKVQVGRCQGKVQIAHLDKEDSGLGSFAEMVTKLRGGVSRLVGGMNSLLHQYSADQRFSDPAGSFHPVDVAAPVKQRRAKSIVERQALQRAGLSVHETDQTMEAQEYRRTFDDLVTAVGVCSSRCRLIANSVATAQSAEALRPLLAEEEAEEVLARQRLDDSLDEIRQWAAQRANHPPRVTGLLEATALFGALTRTDKSDIMEQAEGLLERRVAILLRRARTRTQYHSIRERLFQPHQRAKPAKLQSPRNRRSPSPTHKRRSTTAPALHMSPRSHAESRVSSVEPLRGWEQSSPPLLWSPPRRQKRNRGKPKAPPRSRSPRMRSLSPHNNKSQKYDRVYERGGGVSVGVQTAVPLGRCHCGSNTVCVECTQGARLEFQCPPLLLFLLRSKREQLHKQHLEYTAALDRSTDLVQGMLRTLRLQERATQFGSDPASGDPDDFVSAQGRVSHLMSELGDLSDLSPS
eukprot:Hpha_TRINITY_DN16480_c3_g2::TRINITY_DN16480_c3_g2_i1::g.163728::m.163728